MKRFTVLVFAVIAITGCASGASPLAQAMIDACPRGTDTHTEACTKASIAYQIDEERRAAEYTDRYYAAKGLPSAAEQRAAQEAAFAKAVAKAQREAAAK